jgi:hypothetical protein
MKEIVDRLSKDIAQGVSRRKALWMFLAGTGVLGAFARQKASATPIPPTVLCSESCDRQALAFLSLCLAASENCPSGYCAEFTLLRLNATAVPLTINGSHLITFDETCTPVH